MADWFRALWVHIHLFWRRARTLGIKNILNERRLPAPKKEAPVVLPYDEDVRNKTWVVICDTGQIGVIDHIKPDGRLGVRPVDPVTAAYFPNSSAHWSWEDRLRIPYELALMPGKVRAAKEEEIPYIVR